MNRYSVIFYVFLLLFSLHIVKAQTPQLWGMTCNGGSYGNSYGGNSNKDSIGKGIIFKINEDGTGFDTVHTFDSIDGESPTGNLLLATDGKLYGMSPYGGDSGRNAGVIFSIDPLTNKFTKLFHFENFNGAEPLGSLVEYNGILYGMTYSGGKHTEGVIFSFNPMDSAYTDLHDFDLTGGIEPYFGNLILANNNKLYGMTYKGGNNSQGFGVIFSFDPANNEYTDLYNFNDTIGANPYGSLLQATNGKLYGMCHFTSPLTERSGTIFSFDPDSGIYKDEYDFAYEPSASPYGSFIQIGDSMLYGMTFGGGADTDGNIFSFNIYNDSVTDLYDFNGTNGALPYGNLLLAGNNKLYGMTSQGGYDFGNVFSFDLDSNTCNDLHDFNDSTGATPFGSLIEVTAISGIKQLAGSNYQVSIFPNPASNQVSIITNRAINKIEIINVLGQTVLEKTFNMGLQKQILDITCLSSGMYFIIVSSINEITTKKIVVSR